MTTSRATPGAGPQPTPGTHPRRPRRDRRRRRLAGLLGVALAALVTVTVVWFQPQRLLYDQRVEEPLPRAGTAAAEVATGTFVSREHATHGTARVLRLADGREVVRLEDFTTSNGPALVVWLSGNRADGPSGAFDDAHLDLGPLKGNVGSQNYVVPAGADTASYASV